MNSIKECFQRMFLNFVAFVARRIAKIKAPWTHKKIKAKHYRHLDWMYKNSAIVPGDVLLSFTDGELSNIAIPGGFSHAAMIMENFEVIEAVTKGVCVTDMIDYVMTKDRIVVVRPKFADSHQMLQACFIAHEQIGKPYDYRLEMENDRTKIKAHDLNSGIKAFYCSELIYYAYAIACPELEFIPRIIFGRYTVSPTDFYLAKDKFELIFDSKTI